MLERVPPAARPPPGDSLAYAICAPTLWERLPSEARGQVQRYIDPLRVESGAFADLIEAMDGVVYRERGLSMPRWAYYDCVELPGLLAGFASPARTLTRALQRALGVEATPERLVPVSFYAAVPMLGARRWLGHSLTVLGDQDPATQDLWRARTLALAVGLLPADEITGIAQWAAASLSLQAKLGPLELLSTWTPAHSDPTTCVFRFPTRDARFTPIHLERALVPGERPVTGARVDVRAPGEAERLQDAIEAGRRLTLHALSLTPSGLWADIQGLEELDR